MLLVRNRDVVLSAAFAGNPGERLKRVQQDSYEEVIGRPDA